MPFKISLEFMMLAYKGGRFMDAQRAYQLGIVNEVVPEAELLATAERWAEMLKTIPQLYIKAIKYGHYKAMHMEYLQREMDYAHFIWPQQISEERKEAASLHAREARAGLSKAKKKRCRPGHARSCVSPECIARCAMRSGH